MGNDYDITGKMDHQRDESTLLCAEKVYAS